MHLPETQTAEVELKIENVESVQKQSKPALIWTDLQIEQWEDTEAQQQEQLWQKQFQIDVEEYIYGADNSDDKLIS